MKSGIFTLIIGGASIYFFYENNFFVAIILLTWFFSRLFGQSLKRIFEGINNTEKEILSNITIEVKINIAEILKHSSVLNLFRKLKENEKFKFKDESEWIKTLIENYKKKYGFDNENDRVHKGVRYIWEKAKFNIKNNILWKNNEVDFNDSVEHEIYIPYEYIGQKEEEEGHFYNNIWSGIQIRVLIVNGEIKVQIGDFDKNTTPHFYQKEGLAVYKTWETITSFPLMYVSQSIPINYLNFSMYATESYKGLLSGAKNDWTHDWKELNSEMVDYSYLRAQFASDEVAGKKFGDVYKKFYTKSLEKLSRDNFVDPYKREDDGWPVPEWMEDNSIHYQNKYLLVFLADYKDVKEKRDKYYITDYHEEHP